MTAEDAGAGVQAGTLVLTVRPEGAAPVPLPLHEAEPLIGDWAGQPAVEAGVPVSLEVSGLPPRAAVTVRMGGEVLAADQYREEDCVHLELQDPLPFDNMIGVAKLEVLVSTGPQACSFFHAEPLRIILKPGLASDNLLRMSESVAEHVERLFGGDAVRTGDDSLGDLLGVLERLSSLYERQYPYFREDPKCRLETHEHRAHARHDARGRALDGLASARVAESGAGTRHPHAGRELDARSCARAHVRAEQGPL